MIDTTDATTAIWPPYNLLNNPLMTFIGAKKFTFMTECKVY